MRLVTSDFDTNHGLRFDLLDADLRVRLTVTLFTTVVLFSLHFEDSDLFRASVLDDRCYDLRTFYEWSSDFNVVAAYDQDFTEFYCAVDVCVEFFNVDLLASFNFDLFTTCFDDCVHYVHLLLGTKTRHRGQLAL